MGPWTERPQPELPAQPDHLGPQHLAWMAPGAVAPWLQQGVRTAFFRHPRWEGLQVSPALLAFLLLTTVLCSQLFDRLFIDGPAQFRWQALPLEWLGTLVAGWACYLVRPRADAQLPSKAAPGPAHLFALLLAQALVMLVGLSLMWLLLHSATGQAGWMAAHPWVTWGLWVGSMAWMSLAVLAALWRGGDRVLPANALANGAMLACVAVAMWSPPPKAWVAAAPARGEPEPERPQLALTQEVFEAQSELLSRQLAAISPQRPGVTDLYAITFAPYADEDVFRHEAEMVSEVMGQRFDAAERHLTLINHAETAGTAPWATAANLHRAIRQMAARMNKTEDILFIHLTSHGARDGQLAASFWPLEVEPVRPETLQAWLDEAGVRYRVLSISACFSGSWIKPLSNPNALVMTAADASHTSYGCGRRSPLTFFGRAMYDEALRTRTRSFELAHAQARSVILKREEEAGKSDGYSNPQISVGEGIRLPLAALARRLDATP